MDLTHWGLVTPFGVICLCHHWLRYLLFAWRHKVLTWTNVDFALTRLRDIHRGQFHGHWFRLLIRHITTIFWGRNTRQTSRVWSTSINAVLSETACVIMLTKYRKLLYRSPAEEVNWWCSQWISLEAIWPNFVTVSVTHGKHYKTALMTRVNCLKITITQFGIIIFSILTSYFCFSFLMGL